jgi:hypothetical protein
VRGGLRGGLWGEGVSNVYLYPGYFCKSTWNDYKSAVSAGNSHSTKTMLSLKNSIKNCAYYAALGIAKLVRFTCNVLLGVFTLLYVYLFIVGLVIPNLELVFDSYVRPVDAPLSFTYPDFDAALSTLTEELERTDVHLKMMMQLEREMREIPTKYTFIADLTRAERSGNDTYWTEVFDRVEPAVECVTFKLEKLTQEPEPQYVDSFVTMAYLVDSVHHVFDSCGKLVL